MAKQVFELSLNVNWQRCSLMKINLGETDPLATDDQNQIRSTEGLKDTIK